MSSKENLIKRDVIYQGKIINVYNDFIGIENKNITSYREVVEHNGGVCAVIKTKEQKIKFVRQYRYAFGEFILELPAGKIEKGEDPNLAIAREVMEEVGVSANKITKVGIMYPSPGYCTEIIHLYYVDDYENCDKHFDIDEDLDSFEFTYQEALNLIDEGKIVDAKTICLLLRLRDKFI